VEVEALGELGALDEMRRYEGDCDRCAGQRVRNVVSFEMVEDGGSVDLPGA